MKMFTSYFAKHRTSQMEDVAYVSIAVGNPRYGTPYKLNHCKELKPFGIFGHDLTDEEYIERYREKLDRMGVEKIREAIKQASGGKDVVILLCHEKDRTKCHRGDFAKWWKERTGEEIEEWGEKNPKKIEETVDNLSIMDII